MSLPATTPHMQNTDTSRISRRPTVRAEHVPVALHRFAAPTGPWPWSSDVNNDITDLESLDEGHRDTANDEQPDELTGPGAWRRYPQSLYRNWTQQALEHSGLQIWLNREVSSETAVYSLDVLKNGRFVPLPEVTGKPLDGSVLWDSLNEPVSHILQFPTNYNFQTRHILQRPQSPALRCLFISDLTGTIMQQLGTKCVLNRFSSWLHKLTWLYRYDIEPFFFSSSFNGISSRYQENAQDPGSDREAFSSR